MNKELIIVVIIIISVTILELVTQNYTLNVMKTITNDLSNLKRKIHSDVINKDEIYNETNEIYDKWLKFHDILSLYIDHTELEKVETDFVSCKSLIESSKYKFALAELEKAIFVLDHISDKYAFNLSNIF